MLVLTLVAAPSYTAHQDKSATAARQSFMYQDALEDEHAHAFRAHRPHSELGFPPPFHQQRGFFPTAPAQLLLPPR